MKKREQTNFLSEPFILNTPLGRQKKEIPKEVQTKGNGLFVVFTALSLAVILIILAQPGVQDVMVSWLKLDANLGNSLQPTPIDYSQMEKVRVNRVVDGDTIILQDARRIRYLNIDTPESVHPNEPIQCYGKEAYELNKSLVEGKEVWIKFDKQKEDRYGRLLAFVFLQGRNANDITQSINAYLVQTGFARSYIIKPNNTFAEEFAALELEAKSKKIGIWIDCPKPFEE